MNVMTNSGEKYDIARASGYIQMLQRRYADLTDLIKEHAQDSWVLRMKLTSKGTQLTAMYAFPVNGNVYAQEFPHLQPNLLGRNITSN